MREYDKISIRFVNRKEELEALRTFCSRFRGLPLYVYGPEGCGKTRLMREFVLHFEDYFSENPIALYIDALEDEDIEKALTCNSSIRPILDSVISLLEKLGVPIGKKLAENIVTIIEKLFKEHKLQNANIVVIVDDVVKAIGLEKIEWYVKRLYELLWKIYEKYRPKTINFIIIASEGESLELISRHRHTRVRLIWNLEKEPYKELFNILQPPKNIDFEEIWRLLGGNPGKLIEIALFYNWNTEDWYRDTIEILRPVMIKIKQKDLVNELKMVIEDPDITWTKTEQHKNLLELYKILVKHNLVIYKSIQTINNEQIPENREISVGKYYAWQIPAYRYPEETNRREISQRISPTSRTPISQMLL